MEPHAEIGKADRSRLGPQIAHGKHADRSRAAEAIARGSPTAEKPLKEQWEILGAEHEEALLRVLRQAGPEGLPPGEARRRAELAASTYSAVARRLAESGSVVRHGKRRIQLNPEEWAGSWRSRPSDRAELNELRRREAVESGELVMKMPAPAPSRLPAVQQPLLCTLPRGITLEVALMTGRYRPGSFDWCPTCDGRRCQGKVLTMDGSWVEYGTAQANRASTGFQRLVQQALQTSVAYALRRSPPMAALPEPTEGEDALMRGRLPEEADSARRVLRRLPAERRYLIGNRR